LTASLVTAAQYRCKRASELQAVNSLYKAVRRSEIKLK